MGVGTVTRTMKGHEGIWGGGWSKCYIPCLLWWSHGCIYLSKLIELYTSNVLNVNYASIFIFWPRCTARRILVPRPGTEPGPQQWKHRVLTTGPPGNCLKLIFKRSFLLTSLTLPATLLQDSWRSCLHSLSPILSHIFYLKSTPVRLLFPSCLGNCSHQECSDLYVAKSNGQISFLSHILLDLSGAFYTVLTFFLEALSSFGFQDTIVSWFSSSLLLSPLSWFSLSSQHLNVGVSRNTLFCTHFSDDFIEARL